MDSLCHSIPSVHDMENSEEKSAEQENLAVEAERRKPKLSEADVQGQMWNETPGVRIDTNITATTMEDLAQGTRGVQEAVTAPRDTCGVVFAQQLGAPKVHQKRRKARTPEEHAQQTLGKEL